MTSHNRRSHSKLIASHYHLESKIQKHMKTECDISVHDVRYQRHRFALQSKNVALLECGNNKHGENTSLFVVNHTQVGENHVCVHPTGRSPLNISVYCTIGFNHKLLWTFCGEFSALCIWLSFRCLNAFDFTVFWAKIHLNTSCIFLLEVTSWTCCVDREFASGRPNLRKMNTGFCRAFPQSLRVWTSLGIFQRGLSVAPDPGYPRSP